MRASSPPPSPDDVDPYLQALIGIGAELTAIRRELEQLNAVHTRDSASAGADAADAGRFECRMCGQTFAGEGDAREHAVGDHGAPESMWRTAYDD